MSIDRRINSLDYRIKASRKNGTDSVYLAPTLENMLKLGLLCWVVFAVGTQANDVDRIVGGKAATPNQIPYQVMLRRLTSYAHYCSGAIIGTSFVLTVATCAQGRNKRPAHVRIVIGAHDRSSDGTIISVSKITNHPEFSRTNMKNNICLIKTTNPIPISPIIHAIKLPTSVFQTKMV